MPRKIICKICSVFFTVSFVLSAVMTGTLAQIVVSEKINEISGTNPKDTPEYVYVQGQKFWENVPDDYSLPEYITAYIYADGELCQTVQVQAADNWKYKVGSLPKYNESGTVINYTVDEEKVDGFVTSIDGYNITNRYVPEGETVQIYAKKVWVDDSCKNRPTSVEIRLLADGVESERVTLTETNMWEHIWTDLDPDHDYTVDEPAVPKGYTSEIVKINPYFYKIVNTFGEPKPTNETVTISGMKIWKHGIAADCAKPADVTVYIKNGDTIVREIIVTANDNWHYSVVLPKYDSNNNEIVYTVDEKPIPYYDKKIVGYNIINTYIPQRPIIVTPGNTPDDFHNDTSFTPTGNNTDLTLWLTLMLISAAAVMFVIRRHKSG